MSIYVVSYGDSLHHVRQVFNSKLAITTGQGSKLAVEESRILK